MASLVLYKNIVEPNHVYCEKIEEAVNYYLNKARTLYGDAAVEKVGKVIVEFYDKGRNAAMAVVGKDGITMKWVGIVQFSMRLVITKFAQMMKEIVPHEIAHLICMANRWDMGHGDNWKRVCTDLGGKADTKNNFATIDGRLKNLYEARTEESTYWLTGTQKRMAASTGIMVKDEKGIVSTLTRNSLTGNMKRL